MIVISRVVLIGMIACGVLAGCGGSRQAAQDAGRSERRSAGVTSAAQPARLPTRRGSHARWSATSRRLAGFDANGGARVAAGQHGVVVGWNTPSHGQLLLPGRARPRALAGKITAGPVSYGASGFALVIARDVPARRAGYDPYVVLDVLTGKADGGALRHVELARGVLKTGSLRVSGSGEVAVSWLACNHPASGCYPDDRGTPDAALRLAVLTSRGRRQRAMTLTSHVGDANDVLAYSRRGDLLAAYATVDHIVARVRPAHGLLSAPAIAGRYRGGVSLGAGIDAHGAILTAWSEQICAEQCGRVHVRAARRPAGSPHFGAVQTLEAGHTDARGGDETAGGYLQADISDDGRAAVAWNSPTGLHLATSTTNGRLSAARELSRDPSDTATLAVAADGSAIVVWGASHGSGRMLAVVRPRSQTRFGAPEALPPTTDHRTPQSGFDPVGRTPFVTAFSGDRLLILTRSPSR